MFARSWRTWPDAVIDFGRELYVPWQLIEGKTLYADLAYFNGPLSPYVNALWFRLGGVSLDSLVLANAFLFACLVLLVYGLVKRVGDRWAAAAAGLVLVTLFGFLQLVTVGNYNFICPYSHELTHGLLLSTLALACLAGAARSLWFLVAAGLCTGLVFLTKAEVFLAILLASFAGIALMSWAQRLPARRVLAASAGFLASASLPALVAFVLLSRDLPPDRAWQAVLGTWPHALRSEIAGTAFYRTWMGTLDLGASGETIVSWTLGYAVFFGSAFALAWWSPPTPRVRAWLSGAAFIAFGGALIVLPGVPWHDCARPLPFILAGFVSYLIWELSRQRDQAHVLLIAFGVFAIALLGKAMFYARFFNYGFALTLPATVVFIVLTVSWIPGQLDRRGRNGALFRLVSLAAILVVVSIHVRHSAQHLARHVHPVSNGREMFLADFRGVPLQQALDFVARHVGPDETLAAIPGGVMLNYLARRATSVPYVSYAPFDMKLYGESTVLRALREAPPDYIALVHIDFSEDGAAFIGVDYGFELSQWIRDHYAVMRRFGDPPFRKPDGFGIVLLRRALAN